MTFNQIVLKMFKVNFKRYLLFFLCSTFTITIFFMYATLFTNKQFMDPNKMYRSISSNTIAPSLIIGIFSAFFIMYAQSSFNRFRKPELGLLMVLGCTNNNIRKMILLENSLIALFSLIMGLGIGSVCSKLFYLIIIRITGINEVFFTLNFKSYLYTILLFIIIYAIVITVAMIGTLRLEILNLIKALRIQEKEKAFKPIFSLLGIIIIACSIFDIIINFSIKNPFVILRSLILCFIGIYLVISNFVWINKKINYLSKKSYYGNLLFVSNINNSFGKTKNLLLISTLLIGCAIFFGSLGMVLYSSSKESAIQNNPYDIAYLQQDGYGNIPNDEIDKIVKEGSTPLTVYKELNYVKQNAFMIFSEDEINRILGCDFNIGSGNFIIINQFSQDDGYSHEKYDLKNFEIKLQSGSINLQLQENYIKIIFNPDVIVSMDKIIVVNNSDYLQISKSADKIRFGTIKLFNFKDWKKTQGIVDKLNLELKNYNKGNAEQLEVASKINNYNNNINASSFLLFLFFFVGTMFFIAANIMLHFKLLMEFDREKIKYKKIYRIGIMNREVKKVVNKELRILFFFPVLLGIFIGTLYIYAILNITSKGLKGIYSSLPIGLIYIFLQALVYMFYKKYYVNKLLE